MNITKLNDIISIIEGNRRELLIAFLNWQIRTHHTAYAGMIVEDNVDLFLKHQSMEKSEQHDNNESSVTEVKQCIFVIKDNVDKYVKLFAKKEDAEQDLKLLRKCHSYASFYIDEVKLY